MNLAKELDYTKLQLEATLVDLRKRLGDIDHLDSKKWTYHTIREYVETVLPTKDPDLIHFLALIQQYDEESQALKSGSRGSKG